MEYAGKDGATNIHGGGLEPQFRDDAPKGGLLVGFDLAVLANYRIKAVQPIYRTDDRREVKGETYGSRLSNVITVRAKADYAVGAVSINAGMWIDGIRITFMRVQGDRLDPGDSYESTYYGSTGGCKPFSAAMAAR